MLGDPQQRRPCTMYQLAPQVMIGSVPDTTEPWLSAGRVLSRNQSNPGRKGSAGCEVSAIVNCGDEGGCDNRSYPRQRSQTFATIENGRAACRERGCQEVEISWVAGTIK